MKRLIHRSALYLSAGVLLVSMATSLLLPAMTASAEIANPTDAIEEQTQRWLYYRGMRACIQGGPFSPVIGRADIQDGQWQMTGKKGFGYFAPDMDGADGNDGTVSCTDGSIWVRGATLYGFADPVALLCELNRVIDKGDAITPNNSEDCEKSTEWAFNSYAGANWQTALTAALEKNGVRPRFQIQDNPNQSAMYYRIGQRSVEVFCGSGVALADGIEDLTNDSNRVSVDIVNTETGAVQKSQTYLLKGDRDEDSKVDDVYYNNGGDDNNAIDKKCFQLAELTRDHSRDFATYIIKSLNDGIAEDYKAQFKLTDDMKKAICGDAPAGDGEIISPPEKAYAACIANIVTRFNSAVDTCKTSAELDDDMEFEARQSAMKVCLKKALPKEYAAVIDGLQAVNVEANDAGETGGGPEETSCAVDGIGWIVCPVMNFMAKLNDKAFEFLQSFLTIRPALISDDNTLKAWSSFRDIANVAFVIAFMVIVYSQITSAGVSNYGIKKLLPRIVVAAILVNISYYICALAVDLSNIVGSSVYSLLKDSIGVGGAGAAATGWEGTMEGILQGAAIGIGVVLLLLAVLMAPTALLAFAVVLMILIARQAFVILLVVISPLAFVAYLLPNTESWFKKWWKAFSAVLMVYPIVGVVFGASILASNILSGVKDGTDADLLQIIALGVLAVPLFAVPALLKGSLSAAGSVGSKLQGLADKTQGRASSQLGKNVGKRAARVNNRFKAANIERAGKIASGEGGRLGEAGSRRRRLAGAFAGLGSTAAVNNAQKDKYAEVAATAAGRDYVAGRAAGGSTPASQAAAQAYAQSLAGGRLTPGSKALASDIQSYATQERRESQQKDIKAAREKIANKPQEQLLGAGGFDQSMSGADMAAHAAEIAARGPGAQFHEALNASAKIKNDEHRQLVQKALLDNKREDHFGLSDEDVGALNVGGYGVVKDAEGKAVKDASGENELGVTYEQRLIERAGKKLGGEKLVGLKKHDIAQLAQEADAGNLDEPALQSLADSIADARSNSNVSSKITPEMKAFHERILAQASARGITAAAPTAPSEPVAGSSGIILPGDPGYSSTGGGPTAP